MRTRVKMFREAKGWSRQELAMRSGLSVETIRRLEIGKHKYIYISTLSKLSKVFGVGVSAIVV